jgi:MSHA biogenesis protein MshL
MKVIKPLALTILLLFSCTPKNNVVKTAPKPKSAKKKSTPKKITVKLTPLPLLTPTLREIQQAKSSEIPKITLTLKNVPLSSALLSISKASGYEIVLPQGLNTPVSASFEEIPLDEALKILLTPQGYAFKIEGKRIKVITKETKIFHLNALQVQRNFNSNINANVGGASGSEASNISGTTTVNIADTFKLDLKQTIDTILKEFASEDKSFKYFYEPISGTLIVTGKPVTVERVGKFIEKFNKSLSKQVLIEAKIIEVKLNKENEEGINWKYIASGSPFSIGKFTGTVSFNSGNPGEKPFQIQVVKSNGKFFSIVRLLSKYGKVHVLSSPRILTMNGQPAMIKVGKDYIVLYSSETSSTVTTGGQTATTITSQEVTTDVVLTEGIVLTIIPRVTETGGVILNINPIVSSLDTPLISGTTGSTSEFLNKVYAVNVRQLDTVVKVKDGQTVILGGLIAESKSKNEEGVPVLKDIPLFGRVFKSSEKQSSKTELIITLTPHVEE